jgi:uncharacterized protein
METHGGGYIDFADPQPEAIWLGDVAVALAHTCRFGGHVARFYSVAEHALLVRQLVREHFGRPDLGLAALHHDSHEAYVGDLPTPLKAALGVGYRAMVDRLDGAIAEAFGLGFADLHHPIIRKADELALRWEASRLKRSRGVSGEWAWRELPDVPDAWRPGMAPVTAALEFRLAHWRETSDERAVELAPTETTDGGLRA